MSLVEALIIYLSAGAPFGVLVFFSQRPSTISSVTHAILATAGWPIFGSYRLYRSLIRPRSLQVAKFDDDLIGTLERLSGEAPTEPAELFAIAGHPNPWLATNCYSRSRKKVIDSHRDRLLSPEPLENPVYPISMPLPINRDDLQRVNSFQT